LVANRPVGVELEFVKPILAGRQRVSAKQQYCLDERRFGFLRCHSDLIVALSVAVDGSMTLAAKSLNTSKQFSTRMFRIEAWCMLSIFGIDSRPRLFVAIAVHIYPLSRLVHASPGDWERQLRGIEESKFYANRYYSPLRDGAASYCKSRGRRFDEIVEQVRVGALGIPARRGSDPVKDNVAAFDIFANKFYPRIGKFNRSFLRDDAKSGCEFEGIQLLGLPHFSVTDAQGRDRLVHLYASKWTMMISRLTWNSFRSLLRPDWEALLRVSGVWI